MIRPIILKYDYPIHKYLKIILFENTTISIIPLHDCLFFFFNTLCKCCEFLTYM